MVLCALVVGLCGCGSRYARGYEYRYRAGTMYEYKQLMDAYSADSDQPPPLPPVSDEPGEGDWVRVPVRPGPVFYDDYYAGRRVVVVDDPYYYYDDWYYPRTHIATSFFYGPQRHYRRSGLSIGFGFGHGGYYGHGGHFGHFGHHGHGLGCWP